MIPDLSLQAEATLEGLRKKAQFLPAQKRCHDPFLYVFEGNLDGLLEWYVTTGFPSLDICDTVHGDAPLLYTASSRGWFDIVKWLVNSKANVNAKQRVGSTPLHGAAYYNRTEICKFLLSNGADDKIQNTYGEYPLSSLTEDSRNLLFPTSPTVPKPNPLPKPTSIPQIDPTPPTPQKDQPLATPQKEPTTTPQEQPKPTPTIPTPTPTVIPQIDPSPLPPQVPSPEIPPKNPQNWTTQEVFDFLDSNPETKEFAQLLLDEAIDGKSLLTLNNDDLKDLGLKKLGDRKRLLLIISNISQKETQVGFDYWTIPQNILSNPKWVSKGGGHTPYKSLLVKDENTVVCPEAWQLLNYYLSIPNGQLNISRAYMVYNEHLHSAVQFCKQSFEERFRSSSALFRSESWKSMKNSEVRQRIINTLESYVKKCDWNTGQVSVMPMFHGTSIETAWKIVQTGFATVATLDAGWYGRGIYFTSHVDYAKYYSGLAYPKSPEKRCIILVMVVAGNSFPVTENHLGEDSLSGKPVYSTGYQSHYVTVHKSSGLVADPGVDQVYDELVIFNDYQAVPMFVLEYLDN
uniref:SAM domain-containing protein n=1 Tax=Arcella intermedia TaxID=1963864 RepID=A0A6B2L0J6_9EUKA